MLYTPKCITKSNIVDQKKLIAEKFGIKENSIDFVAGNKENKTIDTYSFYCTKAISFGVIASLMRIMPTIVLDKSIILETKVILRCN